jgi:hypothetical protein
MRLRREDVDHDDEADDDPDQPDPTPAAYAPDIAIRFRDPRPNSDGCLSDDEQESLRRAFVAALDGVEGLGGSEVLFGCIDSPGHRRFDGERHRNDRRLRSDDGRRRGVSGLPGEALAAGV